MLHSEKPPKEQRRYSKEDRDREKQTPPRTFIWIELTYGGGVGIMRPILNNQPQVPQENEFVEIFWTIFTGN